MSRLHSPPSEEGSFEAARDQGKPFSPSKKMKKLALSATMARGYPRDVVCVHATCRVYTQTAMRIQAYRHAHTASLILIRRPRVYYAGD
jgi:hypothetical protein